VEHTSKVAIVTGGGGGMGRAISLALAAEGAAIAVADVALEAAEETAKAVTNAGGRAVTVRTDVTEKQSVDRMTDEVLATFGSIDILVNNAGVQHVAPLADYPLEQWHHVIDVSLTGAFLCTQAVVRSMIPRRRGCIVNISSTLGKEGASFKCAYTAAKHGMIGLTRSNALELAEHDIRINAICPGLTQTQIVENQLDELAAAHGCARDEVLDKAYFHKIPQKRILDPKEIADCVVFLCSQRARAFTGQALNVAAGAMM
jgi:3-hydroxybutyrate dehydrogenase